LARSFQVTIRTEWDDEGTRAVLLDDNGSLLGWIRREEWFEDGSRTPQLTWVLAYALDGEQVMSGIGTRRRLDPGSDPAADETQRAELETRALELLDEGPPPDSETRIPTKILTPNSREDRLHRIDLGIQGWSDASGRLHRAAQREEEWALDVIGMAMTELLAWTRLLDDMFSAAWRRGFSDEIREEMSSRADEQLRRAADSYPKPPQSRPFLDLYQREKDGKPYDDWAAAMAGYHGGAAVRGDLQAFRWLAGKLLHVGPRPVVELRHLQIGGQPRWKWIEADRIVPRKQDRDRDRADYERHLQGRDVLGSLTWIDTWIEAQFFVIRLYKEAGV
jgi:hypothetical protein